MTGIARSETAAFTPVRERRRSGRARVIRRVVLFQVKLMADGFRDVVMSPLSIAAGVIGVLFHRHDGDVYFDRLMRFGRDTDHWINLFDHRSGGDGRNDPSLDTIADDIENAIRRDYARGGVSARSAEALSEVARNLRRRSRRP